MYQAMTFRLRRLLEGLGNGFLSRRLTAWLQREGKVRSLPGGKLEVEYAVKNEFNDEKVTLLIDKRHRIERVTRHSNRGVTRTMRYTYQMIDGRNLVSRGDVSVSFDDNAKIDGKLRVRLMTMDGMIYQLTYKKIGRFYLPTQIYRKSPKLAQQISLDLTYTDAT